MFPSVRDCKDTQTDNAYYACTKCSPKSTRKPKLDDQKNSVPFMDLNLMGI